MQDFRQLKVWMKSHALVLAVYKATAPFPKVEVFGLTNQIRRAAVSIPSNIAEGCGRGSDQDFARFLQMAMGSASEVEYQLLLARDLGYMMDAEHSLRAKEIIEVKRMLAALIAKVKS
ncbi:MAG: four helix bundle protein [Gemmataceae bacterium]